MVVPEGNYTKFKISIFDPFLTKFLFCSLLSTYDDDEQKIVLSIVQDPPWFIDQCRIIFTKMGENGAKVEIFESAFFASIATIWFTMIFATSVLARPLYGSYQTPFGIEIFHHVTALESNNGQKSKNSYLKKIAL